ncbi:MAG: penicillin-binding protein [Candidatus Magasanikbacteria bacterium]
MPIPSMRRTYGAVNPNEPEEPRQRRSRLRISRGGWSWLIKWGVVGLIFLFVVGTGVVIWVSKDLPDPNKLSNREINQSTKIYDRTGTHLLYEVYQNQKRTLVDLSNINPLAAKAVIAIEDKYFYEHNGVRVVSILRAGFNNLIGRKTGGGGASTLTQQLIKNVVVGDSYSYLRKIKEAIMALRLEQKFSKDEILKMYLNEIPYGSTNYGIESASQSYFHKSAKDINLSESATLAAMIQAPSRYLGNPNSLRGRRDTVLRLMFDQGYITEAQKNEAQNLALHIYRSGGIMDAPHFVLYVKQLLADKFGENLVDTGGLKVITALDYDKQKIAEAAVKELGDKFAKSANADNAALVAIDPKSGQILSMVGSRDFFNDEIDGQFNVAVLGRRQPGSSLKPFIYTAAFELGYTPETVLYDTITNFDKRNGGDYTPHNYDQKEHGLVTMRTALQGSLNIPAVKTLYLVGVKETFDFLKRFGYTSMNENAGLSLVLGGAEVNLLEHTNGYATLANNGAYHEPVAILKVTNEKGDVLAEWRPSEGTEAIKPELAATISNVLSDDGARAYVFGRGSTLFLADRPVAAKTGTTNDYKDAWTIGYTPSLAAGVWVGNTTPAPMKGGGNTLAGQIWNRFMKLSLASTSAEQFPEPPANDAAKPVLRGATGGIKIEVNKFNGMIAVSSTPKMAREERIYLPPHDILNYVVRTDPRGPDPSNPSDDPQYAGWEEGLQSWVYRMSASGTPVVLSAPPTGYDTGQSAELMPTVMILSPTASSTLTGRDLAIAVRVSAPRGVTQVHYEVDNYNLGIAREFPFSFNYTLNEVRRGWHVLTATASNEYGDTGAAQIPFFFDIPDDAPSVAWVDRSTVMIRSADFPRAMYLVPYRWDDTKEVNIYLTANGKKKWIYVFNHAEDKLTDDGKLMFTWRNYPGQGDYILTAVLTDNSNQSNSQELTLKAL